MRMKILFGEKKKYQILRLNQSLCKFTCKVTLWLSIDQLQIVETFVFQITAILCPGQVLSLLI